MLRLALITLYFFLFAHAEAPAMTFSEAFTGGNCDECSWVAADGPITATSAGELRAFLNTRLQGGAIIRGTLVVINSPGGDLWGGMELGKVIRELGLEVSVGETYSNYYRSTGEPLQDKRAGVCASACIFALMGGVKRELADAESRVGVHQFAPTTDRQASSAAVTSASQMTVAVLQQYTASMDVDPILIGFASAIPPEDIHWLTVKQMEEVNLLTSRSRPKQTAWNLEPLNNTLSAKTFQDQEDGRIVGYMVDCSYLYTLIPISTHLINNEGQKSTVNSLPDGVNGAALTAGDGDFHNTLTLESASIVDNALLLFFRLDYSVVSAISSGRDDLELSLDIARVYWGYIGAPNYMIPTSNFTELTPHLQKACG